VDAALVEAAHAEGRRVIAWTVNDAGMMRRFASWGVDAICTDDVALARATLRT
jgi:glycerophosphoryl diester phosphodiesterase